MRFVLAAVLLVHGLLHLLGVFKAREARVQPERAAGVLWGLACLTLLAGSALVALGREVWWWVAAAGVVLSQALIVTAWVSARAGTILNLLLAVPIVVAAGTWRFERETDAAVVRLWHAPAAPAHLVSREELALLPAPVRRWLEGAGVVGQERAQAVRLRQRGWLRTSPDEAWMPAEARQYFRIDEPGFVWSVDVTMRGVLPVLGRDSYADGQGRVLIKAAGLVSVIDGRGAKVDEAALLRYLGEIVWFPSAALAPYVRWTAIDDTSARAAMSYAGVSAAAMFSFDEQGRMVHMTADRYRGSDAAAARERWEVPVRAWRRMGGALIPTEGSVVWKLPGGDFDYFQWEITEVEVNRPELYPHDRASAPHDRAPPLNAPTAGSRPLAASSRPMR
jgi:hypothetical protein